MFSVGRIALNDCGNSFPVLPAPLDDFRAVPRITNQYHLVYVDILAIVSDTSLHCSGLWTNITYLSDAVIPNKLLRYPHWITIQQLRQKCP